MKLKLVFACLVALGISCKEEQKIVRAYPNPQKSKKLSVSILDFKGLKPVLEANDTKVRVINFWATWCKPCISKLPYFEFINSRYANKNVEVILVSLDLPSELKTKLIPFIQKKQLKSKVVLLDDTDSNSWIPKVAKNWTGSLPATLIYKGNKGKFFEKNITYNLLENAIQQLL